MHIYRPWIGMGPLNAVQDKQMDEWGDTYTDQYLTKN